MLSLMYLISCPVIVICYALTVTVMISVIISVTVTVLKTYKILLVFSSLSAIPSCPDAQPSLNWIAKHCITKWRSGELAKPSCVKDSDCAVGNVEKKCCFVNEKRWLCRKECV